MRRPLYTSKYSAVLLSSLLAVAFGSASQSARSIQDIVHGTPPTGAETERDETGGDLLSHVRFSEAASPKPERVDTDNPVSLHSNALQFGPHADANVLHQTPLTRYFSGYFHKQKDAAGRETGPKHVVRAGSQVKPPESFRRKRSTDSSIKLLLSKDNKGDNGDHPLPDERGAKVHCWNEANVFDVILPASEVAKNFPHECQHPLSCNTTCVAKVPGGDVCARLKAGCTEPTQHAVPEAQLQTAQNENKQLASFGKNVERRLGELEAKLAQQSLESTYHKDKLVELGHNLNHLSKALKEQLAAASAKTLNSLDRKAAEMEASFKEKSESMVTAISSVLSLIRSDSKTHMWTLKGYAALKVNAIKHGPYWSRCQKVYVGRYLISWGMEFRESTVGFNLLLSLQLHKGISDEFLEWPFHHELKLSVIHPESGEKQEGRQKASKSEALWAAFARPVGVSNEAVSFGGIKFTSSYLQGNGYVKNDQLLLKLEILS